MSTSLLLLEFPKTTIKGDCSLVGFENHISLDSFSWGMKAVTTSLQANQKPRTSVKLNRLSFTKCYDRASVQLCNMMNRDAMFIRVVLKFIDPATGSGQGWEIAKPKFETVMEMELGRGYIESISVSVTESSKSIQVKEDVVLSFHDLVINYYTYDAAKKTRIKASPFEAMQPELGDE